MDDNLRRRVAVVLDHLDEQMRSGAHVVRELLAEAETASARAAKLEAEVATIKAKRDELRSLVWWVIGASDGQRSDPVVHNINDRCMEWVRAQDAGTDDQDTRR